MTETENGPLQEASAEAALTGAEESLVVISKAELLETLQQIRSIMLEYGLMVENIAETDTWSRQALELVRTHQALRGNGAAPLSKIDLVIGVCQFLVSRIDQDQFHFKIPSRVATIPEGTKTELADFSEHLKGLKSPIENLVAQVLALANSEEAVAHDKVHALLFSIAAFFKAIVRQDWEDLTLIVSHINLITTSQESHDLVSQVARIARTIYDSLNEFSEYFTMESLTHSTEEIPDALDKLRSVIGKLEEAANTNLDSLEQLNGEASENTKWATDSRAVLAGCDGKLAALEKEHPELAEAVGKIRANLAAEVDAELANLQQRGEQAGKTYMSLIANQGFQDLTGQTLKKVISFIESLQYQLIDLLPAAETGGKAGAAGAETATEDQKKVPVQTQDQVDHLLADLGF